MKLDWKRAGCASIAECRGFTFICEWIGKNMSCDVMIRGIDGTLSVSRAQKDIDAAEAYCEDWIDLNDRPEWHDVTDWLSWAEWRGWKIFVRPSAFQHCQFTWMAVKGILADSARCFTVEDAKASAEKWVREQGEKA